MNNRLIKTVLLAVGVLNVSATSKAQISVRDSDHEARNAYQSRCFALNPSVLSTTCSPPALPPDRRLAVRFIAISCSETGTQFLNFFPKRASTITGSKAFLSESVYLHTDRPPQITVSWEGDGHLACTVHVLGYLVSKQ